MLDRDEVQQRRYQIESQIADANAAKELALGQLRILRQHCKHPETTRIAGRALCLDCGELS